MTKKKRIGILTGGGDCPGLNPAIRAVAKTAFFCHGGEVIGFLDGFEGLIKNRTKKLSWEDVSGILTQGGTILGTSNRANPFAYGEKKKDVSRQALRNFSRLKLDALICIGGDGTLHIAHKLHQMGVPVVGIPKTIDNDVDATDFTIGFDSAVAVATESVDNIHSTAESHHRVMMVEVMGRYTGWLALYAGVAGGGDVILIPEIPFDIKKVCRELQRRSKIGKRFSIVVVAEGVKLADSKLVIKRKVKSSTDPIRLGGVSYRIAEQIENLTDLETRVIILGHLQRGGKPTDFDRILATQFGKKAVDLVMEEKFGCMTSLQGGAITSVPIRSGIARQKMVTPDFPLIEAAKAVGTCFGD
ncbi:MAG: 6-phosphofructokinase [candidate division Zixibacteria bacterium SM23_73_3]|nr:MAG: 6-phosphofructokinase [candidate division Zixibacteria bacterium SM23_73_3]